MADLRNKAKKEAEKQEAADRERRRIEGWTVFHFDFNPKHTRRNLAPGEALRHLTKITDTKVSLWRCPVRGLAVQCQKRLKTAGLEGPWDTYRILHFSKLENETEAKRALTEDMLLFGIEGYRGLPNKVFDEQVRTLKCLLTAPPRVDAKEWLAVKATLPSRAQRLLQTHEAELRLHLLGQESSSPTSPARLTVSDSRRAAGATA